MKLRILERMSKTMNSNQNKVMSGLFWSFAERISAQLVSTLVTIILARILEPSHYGVISIVTVFITFCNVFVSSGMGSAIVQKKEISEQDYNTAFFISIVISVVLYTVLFICSPYIASFYKMPELKSIIRVMSLRLPIAAINSIQQARIRREMMFKKFFIATSLGTVISGVVGIILAYNGFGAWALVAQYLTNAIVDTGVLSIVQKWFPKLRFSIANARVIFSFGWKVLVTELVYTLQGDIRSLIIGKVFGASDLAFYDQGQKYPALFVNNINAALNKVMLPTYSKNQDNIPKLKEMLRKTISAGIFVLAPIMLGFAAIADTFISVVLTDKWILCKPYIQIFCLYFLTRPLETGCHQAILAIGRSDIALRIIIVINAYLLIVTLVSSFVFKSILMTAVGSLLSSLISLLCFMYYSRKLLDYRIKEQLEDILPPVVCGVIMAIFVSRIGLSNTNEVLLLLIQVTAGFFLYLIFALLMKINSLTYIFGLIKNITDKH